MRCRHTWFLSWIAIAVQLAMVVPSWGASPYIPSDDGEVLETLPQVMISGKRDVGQLRRRLAENPQDVALAIDVATRFLQMGNYDGDPRYFGHAQAVLRPWWETPDAPVEILRLRAKLREKDHEYDQSLVDLLKLLDQQPNDLQAWIEVANIYRLQGKYENAQQVADRLSHLGAWVPHVLSRVPILALTGHAQEAYDLLVKIRPVAIDRYPSTLRWIVTMQADVAQTLGNNELAELHFREGLAQNPNDRHLIRAFADFLLDRQRPQEVIDLVKEHLRDDGILLCGAIAARRLGHDLAPSWRKTLEDRFQEVRLRGSQPHARYEGRCALELQDKPKLALQYALTNWKSQKEYRDTRNVLESAIAANQPAAASEALAFMRQWGCEHVELQKLVRQLESSP